VAYRCVHIAAMMCAAGASPWMTDLSVFLRDRE
jgi:hypothetical protein